MSSSAFSKSKAFKEKEQKVKENLSRATKQDLVADLSRLFRDSTFTDVLLIVDKTEFPVHAAILKARAPNFSQHFLPAHVSSDAIQTCIQINGINPTEFEAFLWSAYTEDYFKDYDQASYPWAKQEFSSSTVKHGVHMAGSEVTGKAQPWLQSTSSELERINSNKPHSDIGVCGKNTTDKPVIDYEKHMDNFDGDISALGSCKETCSQTLEGNGITKLNGIANSFIFMQRRGRTDSNESLEAANNENTSSAVQASVCRTALQNNGSDGFEETIQDNSEAAFTQPATTEEISSNEHSGACNGLDSTVQLNELIVKTSDLTMTNVKIRKTSEGIVITNDDEFYISIEMGRPVADDHDKPDDFTHVSRVNGCVSCNSIGCETMPESAKDHVASPDTGNSTCSKTVACMVSEDELLQSCCKLGQDLLKLLRSGVESDVTFLIGEKPVKAHKAILCARSNYFSAMLHGGWSEEMYSEIPLIGVNYNGMMIVLNYIYGGTAQVPSDVGTICDVLLLADMYGLEGLKEVIISTLRIEKCHLFHKPCCECMTSIFECLELSEMFQLSDLKSSCIKWVAKHFDRVLSTKGFAFLPKALQDEIVTEIQSCILVSSAIEVLNHCDRLFTCTPLVKWTEPVHAAVSAIQDACLLFITDNFLSLVGEKSFEEVLKGVGWSIPVLEKIFSAVQGNLTVESCCAQLRAVLRLRGLLKQKEREEEELEKKSDWSYPEEVIEHVDKLHSRCVEYIRSNFFKVTRSSGWKQLNPRTQREVKEGAMFVGLGETGTLPSSGRSSARNGSSLAQASRRPLVPTRFSFQATGTRLRAAGPGRQAAGSVGRTSATGKQGGSTVLTASCMRPSRGRPSSAQAPLPKGGGKPPSSSQCSSSKRPSSAKPSSSSNLHGSSRKPSAAKICSSSNGVLAVKASTTRVSSLRQGAVPSVSEPSLASKNKSCSSAVAPAGETFLKGHGRGTSSAERSSSEGSRGRTGKGSSTPWPLPTFKNSIHAKASAGSRPQPASSRLCREVAKSSKATKPKKAHETTLNKGTQKGSVTTVDHKTNDMANQQSDHEAQKSSKEAKSKKTNKVFNEEIRNERADHKPDDKANQESHSTQQNQECPVNQQNDHEQMNSFKPHSNLNAVDSTNGGIQNGLGTNTEHSARDSATEENISIEQNEYGAMNSSKFSNSNETLDTLDEETEDELASNTGDSATEESPWNQENTNSHGVTNSSAKFSHSNETLDEEAENELASNADDSAKEESPWNQENALHGVTNSAKFSHSNETLDEEAENELASNADDSAKEESPWNQENALHGVTKLS